MSNTSGRFRKLPEYENSQITNKIKEKIHSKRDRTILYLKLVDDLSFMMIANKLNMPMSTVTSVYYKQIDIVFEGFEGYVPRR